MKTTAELFKSLADETRLRLLVLLQSGNEHCVCDLMYALDMPQSTVSRHLAYLKRNGWLQDRRGGVWMYYSLKKEKAAFHHALLLLLTDKLASTAICQADKQRLDTYLRSKDGTVCG
jgi:ArsR family transcriptional regulator, arsenate/arsenite/antimonite-responsive transcriptional repressor